MKEALRLAVAIVTGCVQMAAAQSMSSHAIGPDAALYATYAQGDALIFAGYGYDRKTFAVTAFDAGDRAVTAHLRHQASDVSAVCETPDGILLERAAGGELIGLSAGALSITPSLARCPANTASPACGRARSIFQGYLPGRTEILSICHDPEQRATRFHLTSATGEHRALGEAGISPAGSGKFVVTTGLEPDTYLVHHTRSAIRESAVLIDAAKGTVAPYALPDLSQVLPSRGLGAGTFGLTLYQVRDGLIADSEGGQVLFLKNGKAEVLSEDVATGSLRITDDLCSLALIGRADTGAELRIFALCSSSD